VEKVWQDEGQTQIEGAHLVREMKSLRSFFQEVKLLHVGREANKAVHRCAKEALIIGDFCCDVMPGFVADVIQSDWFFFR
jgi:hypothetical protein